MDNKTLGKRLRRMLDGRRAPLDREAIKKAVALIEELEAMRDALLAPTGFPEENSGHLAEALVKLLGLDEVVTSNGERQFTSVPQV